ncbi:choline dehydrogenase [Mycobacterium stomatepiae]|uniref:Choline dehydrogenase n=1 Tax=Mycobacterium stomatepiae TaxID=470076 RepID=A0A7I7Q6F5_9MYCO|nr:GMC family oxidoreductase N-terminal domain-containing protein [Mycobacterium stomatepiae]MCV7165707.1 GMC family oxidoreductase N-terminal domain-containing protein [Mycobacterium stomatepiae]BBY21701.1 choline dehydrogenase [Mycobacterium stomatepiae]
MQDTAVEFEVDQRFGERVAANQAALTATLKPRYDFIVCGSGSSGSVVARRLAENPDLDVLLVEAGGGDNVAEVVDPGQWTTNLGSERDWGFRGKPNPHINNRSIVYSTGKVLGGSSSINVMAWIRGHRDDWNHFAAEAGDPAWNYESILDTYRDIEDWHGTPDPVYRGSGGPVFVQPPPDPNPLALATLDAAQAAGMTVHASANGQLMEGTTGAALGDVRIRNGQRQSVFRSYVFPLMDRPNLTVLTRALVQRIVVDGDKAVGVEILYNGLSRRVDAGAEVVLSLGANHTPKVLMLSGIGDQDELNRVGIPVRQHLPGVGRNLQDHVAFDCVWEYRDALPPRNNACEVVALGATESGLTHPDVFAWQVEVPYATEETAARFGLPEAGWGFHAALAHPKSRGRIRLGGPGAADPVCIDANTLADPEDVRKAIACVQWCRDIANSAPLRPYVKREVMPGNLSGAALEEFVRDAASTFFHQVGTAKMGRDAMSVVDGDLRVYGIENLRVADGSVMPTITATNTMAPCVVIGERAAQILKHAHRV